MSGPWYRGALVVNGYSAPDPPKPKMEPDSSRALISADYYERHLPPDHGSLEYLIYRAELELIIRALRHYAGPRLRDLLLRGLSISVLMSILALPIAWTCVGLFGRPGLFLSYGITITLGTIVNAAVHLWRSAGASHIHPSGTPARSQ